VANCENIYRSNHFKVKDPDAFRAWAKKIDLQLWESDPTSRDTLFAFGAFGHQPYEYYDEERDDYHEFDFYTELQAHLQTDQVVVVHEIYFEKLRYVVGESVALHADGRVMGMSLNEMLQRVENSWGIRPTEVAY
jgi:hypothetical protein